ncbi:MAG: hypothetical protein WBD07_05150 [Vicinamibacterales bacterium]
MATEQTFFSRPDSFMTVRHLTIHGTNFEIGQQVGQLARERYGKTPEHSRGDPLFVRARRTFIQRSYPIQWERIRGVAAAFGIDPNDDRYDIAGLTYHMDVPMPPSGCSAVYYPPSAEPLHRRRPRGPLVRLRKLDRSQRAARARRQRSAPGDHQPPTLQTRHRGAKVDGAHPGQQLAVALPDAAGPPRGAPGPFHRGAPNGAASI